MNGILYFECTSGISGDMSVAAMLDLGADEAKLRKALESLGLEGTRFMISDVSKSGLRAKDFAVLLEEDNHDHDTEYLYGSHHHDHHGHDHHHSHRHLPEILSIIEHADMSQRAKGYARRIFEILGEAEAEAHGVPLERVHFHEVGAADSIMDIVAIAVCLDDLDPDGVCFSPLYEGTGTVRCQHGILPVPVPAVANIVRAHGITLRITDSKGEYVTPTGAAFAAACRTIDVPGSFRIEKIGIGAGKRESERSGILRAMIITPDNPTDTVMKLECGIDDCTGEELGHAMEVLMSAGAKDVSYHPIYMKKNRPAWMLTVICAEKDRQRLEDIVFRETTTIGIRRIGMERTVLQREYIEVETPYGAITVKVSRGGGVTRYHPEYDEVSEACRRTGAPLRDIQDAAIESARRVDVRFS